MKSWLVLQMLACSVGFITGYICNVGSTVTLEPGLGESGALHSANYPQHYPSVDGQCDIRFTVCTGCSLQLEFHSANLPKCKISSVKSSTSSKCDNRCEYFIWKPVGKDPKIFIDDITGLQQMGPPTKDVTLTFCYSQHETVMSTIQRLWVASFHVVDGATRRIHGTSLDSAQHGSFESSKGTINSPNFPKIATNGTYIYYFEGQNTNDRIYITFRDYGINEKCYLKFIDGISSNAHMTSYRHRSDRPFFGSSSQYLVIEYHIRSTSDDQCFGWKLDYEFGSSSDIGLFPVNEGVRTDCGTLQLYSGGVFELRGQHNTPLYYDCIWVLTTNTQMRVYLKLFDTILDTRPERLKRVQIIKGPYSTGRLLATLTETSSLLSLPPQGFSSADGFYIRLQASLVNTDRLKFAYATFEQLTSLPENNVCERATSMPDWTHQGFVCNVTRRCIAQSLVCDDVDHCGDGGDELPSWCSAWSESPFQSHCPPNFYNCAGGACVSRRDACIGRVVPGGGACTNIRKHECESIEGTICFSDFEKCNGVKDCPNNVDEQGCSYISSGAIDGRFLAALKSFWILVRGTWYFYLPAVILIVCLFLVLCCYKCKQNSDRKKFRKHRGGGHTDISQPMIGGDKKDQYEAVTPSECSDNGKPMLQTAMEGLEGVAIL